MMKWKSFVSERTIILFLIILTLAVGGIVLYTLSYLIEHMQNWWWLIGFLLYIALLEVIYYLRNHFDFRIIQIIDKIILVPIIAAKLLLDIAKPSIYIFSSFLYLIMVAFLVPFSLLKLLNMICCWSLNISTIFFVSFALGSILCVHQSQFVQYIICKIPPLNRGEHKFQKLGRDLSKYILHPRNLSFILFFSYFIYLAVSGFIQLQYKGYLISEDIDSAILKAFLVFIACTNMIVKSREVDVDSKELLARMLNLMDAHDD